MEKISDIFLSAINENKGIIYKVANAYCWDQEDRKDLVQEIIFQLWRCFDRYDDQYQYSTWIYRIALNVAISFCRKEVRRKGTAQSFSKSMISFIQGSEYEDTENLHLLKKFISELKELDRALMILYLEDKSYREIADILGLTETNIATKIGRIKEKLRKRFSMIKNN